MADFTGDAKDDLVGTTSRAVYLFPADDSGKLTKPGIKVHELTDTMPADPMVMTAGDIDNDGDLDVWLGQYTPPYETGQMPTPYYDANDGANDYLLRNDGGERFTDVTLASGLGEKRNRRTYAASFADIDDDSDVDLIVISDFSGVDVFENDGSGSFTDVTDSIDERHAFGMSLTFADYDLDSNLDFYMVGMSSTTAKRLPH